MTKVRETKLDFAGDYSGICYEPVQNNLWIVSHESKTISRCDLSGKVLDHVKVNINKIEGIAVDYPNKRVYVVSDIDKMLFIYSIN